MTTIEAFAREQRVLDAKKKERGPRGEVGKGTPGSRLKAHRPDDMPLRKFARMIAAGQSYLKADAQTWLASKDKKPVRSAKGRR